MYGSISFRAKISTFDEKTASPSIKALPSNVFLYLIVLDYDFVGEVGASKTTLAKFGYADIERWGGPEISSRFYCMTQQLIQNSVC